MGLSKQTMLNVFVPLFFFLLVVYRWDSFSFFNFVFFYQSLKIFMIFCFKFNKIVYILCVDTATFSLWFCSMKPNPSCILHQNGFDLDFSSIISLSIASDSKNEVTWNCTMRWIWIKLIFAIENNNCLRWNCIGELPPFFSILYCTQITIGQFSIRHGRHASSTENHHRNY